MKTKKCKQCHKEMEKPYKYSLAQWKSLKFCSRNCLYKNMIGRKLGYSVWNKGLKGYKAGEKHPRWKGGYENKLFHNRKRRILKLNAKGSHTQKEWQELKKKYNFTCPACGKKEPEIRLTEDHIIPLSKGGTDNIDNIQPLCKSCNSKKNNKIINYG